MASQPPCEYLGPVYCFSLLRCFDPLFSCGLAGAGEAWEVESLWESQLTSVHTFRVMTVPATAIYFTAYDQLKTFLCGRALTSDLYAPMVAGALARCEHSPGPLISLTPSRA